MALRTNEVAIKQLIQTSLTTPQINRCLTIASSWVDEELVNEGMSTDRLEIIEQYLTCALIRNRDLGLKSAKFDDIAEQYQVDPTVSGYLLTAASYDSSGKVRQHWLAGKDTRSAKYRVGTRYVDDD
jgi:hypothetical protein